MFQVFGNQPFFKNKAQELLHVALVISYQKEEWKFNQTVIYVTHEKELKQANIIGLHVIYKLK